MGDSSDCDRRTRDVYDGRQASGSVRNRGLGKMGGGEEGGRGKEEDGRMKREDTVGWIKLVDGMLVTQCSGLFACRHDLDLLVFTWADGYTRVRTG